MGFGWGGGGSVCVRVWEGLARGCCGGGVYCVCEHVFVDDWVENM